MCVLLINELDFGIGVNSYVIALDVDPVTGTEIEV